MEQIYKNLTSIDIEEQKKIWDERGKGYYGEYLLFTELYQKVKGQCKILMNLNIPAGNGRTTEIDLLMIHESGLYVFEVKHYKGTIYGRYEDKSWTQYFRTQKNSHFTNPIHQNEYHVNALRNMLPGIPIYSFIVFTNDETEIKVSGWENKDVIVCKRSDIEGHVSRINASSKGCLLPERIEELFESLCSYAPIMSETICEDGVEYPLKDYVNQIKSDYTEGLQEAQRSEKIRYKRRLSIGIILALVVCGITVLLSTAFMMSEREKAQKAEQMKTKAEQELMEFSKKFRKAEPMNGGEAELKDGFLEIVDYALDESKDLKDTVLFTCKIKVNGAKYGIRLHNKTSILVQMRDGSVSEYVLSEHVSGYFVKYVATFSWHSNEADLPEIQIYAKKVEDISYIKLTNIQVISSGNMQKDLLPGTEFELYSAEKNATPTESN